MRMSAGSEETFYVYMDTDYDPTAYPILFGLSSDVDEEPSAWVAGEWMSVHRKGNKHRSKAKLPTIGETGALSVASGDQLFAWADVDGERQQFDYLLVS